VPYSNQTVVDRPCASTDPFSFAAVDRTEPAAEVAAAGAGRGAVVVVVVLAEVEKFASAPWPDPPVLAAAMR
jgi:hypothetical protein